MAIYYLRSTDGDDADDGSTWALAFATLNHALSQMSAGDRLWISQNHAESTASAVIMTSPGTTSAHCEVFCGNDAAEPPTALTTGASVTTTGASNITFRGHAHYHGIDFSCGTGASTSSIYMGLSSASTYLRFDSCGIRILPTAGLNRVQPGVNGGRSQTFVFNDCEFEFGHVGNLWLPSNSYMTFDNCTWETGSITPTQWFGPWHSSGAAKAIVRNCEMPFATRVISQGGYASVELDCENCRIESTYFDQHGASDLGGPKTRFVNCDDSGTDTNYRYEKTWHQGSITSETTIVRTGGATDGTTAISRCVESDTYCPWYAPLESDWMAVWLEKTGESVTLSVEIVSDNVTYDNDEVWLEVDGLATASNSIGTRYTDGVADPFETPAAQPTSTVDWTTTGLTTPVKQTLSVSFTPQEKGPAQVRVMCAKASTTFYFCPKVEVS